MAVLRTQRLKKSLSTRFAFFLCLILVQAFYPCSHSQAIPTPPNDTSRSHSEGNTLKDCTSLRFFFATLLESRFSETLPEEQRLKALKKILTNSIEIMQLFCTPSRMTAALRMIKSQMPDSLRQHALFCLVNRFYACLKQFELHMGSNPFLDPAPMLIETMSLSFLQVIDELLTQFPFHKDFQCALIRARVPGGVSRAAELK